MKYIKGFDTLRAISIIMVLSNHLGLYYELPDSVFFKERVWLLISGGTGVQIFFTLSGFLITKILLQELKDFGNINFRNFYIRRFLRLSPPLVLFYITIAVLMSLDMIRATMDGFLFSFFYLYNFVPDKYYTGELGHTWSLALEEQYYLLWPFVINFLNRKKVFVSIFFILLCCLLAVYIYPTFSFAEDYKLRNWFIPAVAPIIIGSLSALIIQKNNTKYFSKFSKKSRPLLMGVILFLFPVYTPFLELSFLFQSAGISIVLIWILYNQQSKLTNLLDNKLLSYIGRISYGIYVYQGLFLRTGPSGELWIQQFPQNIMLTLFTAILSFELLEKTILKLKKKYKRTPLSK